MFTVRYAQEKDAKSVMRLLRQVLEVHAKIRPDIFLSGSTKYSEEEVVAIIRDGKRRTFVAEERGIVVGYALCILEEKETSACMVPHKTLYVDDLCVEETERGKGVASALFSAVKDEAIRLGCYAVTLNVWEGNDNAKAFYEKMGMTPRSIKMECILS